MKNTTDLIQTLNEETDSHWTPGHDTNTYTELEDGDGRLITISAWDSNELNRWNLTYRDYAEADPVVSDAIPVPTDDLGEAVLELI